MHRSPPTSGLAQTCRAVVRDFPALTNARRQVTAVLRRRWRRDEEFGRALIHRGSASLFALGTVSISSSDGSSPAPLSPSVHASLFFASCSILIFLAAFVSHCRSFLWLNADAKSRIHSRPVGQAKIAMVVALAITAASSRPFTSLRRRPAA